MKTPFGPNPMLFEGLASGGRVDGTDDIDDAQGKRTDEEQVECASMEVKSRHTSLFGSLDWTMDMKPAELPVDEYFMGSASLRNAVSGLRKVGGTAGRRHSIAGLHGGKFEENLADSVFRRWSGK